MTASPDPDDVATKLLKPPPTITIETPEQALLYIKAHRVRGLMLNGTIASLVAGVLVLFVMGGDPYAQRVHTFALFGSAAITGLYAIAYRDPRSYSQLVFGVVIVTQIPLMLTGYYYWGVFSAYAAIVPLNIFIASDAAEATWSALITVMACIVAQTLLMLATVFGWIETRSLVDVVRGTQTNELVAVGLIGMLALGAALLGREAKQRTGAILREHALALRAVAQREAQLVEAQAEVAAARKAGQGGPGWFTDQNIGGFVLGDVLGRGTMGDVYQAVRVGDALPCAVKLLAGHLLRDAEANARFSREAAMLVKLDSPHVVRVLAVSDAAASQPYLAMERLDGIDLAQLLKERDVIPLVEIVDIVAQVAAGLDVAHRAGVIHRDLKPQNLFAAGTAGARIWKVIDFGIGAWADGDGSLTHDRIIGSPGYMAPEQALGHAVTARSDVYALGVILYRLVSGVPVVRPGEVPAMLHEVVYRMPAAPSSLTEVPPSVEEVLAVALAKDPSERFASAGELARALADAADGRLAHALVQRASQILAKTPWGAWIER